MTRHPRNIQRSDHGVPRAQRERRLGQRGAVVWFTGLSGAGKSTIARALEAQLAAAGRLAYVLDGDDLRHGLCQDLGFSASDRGENIRRASHVAALMADAGILVLTAFISPFASDRARARAVIGGDFVEVFVDATIDTCAERDPKGLYARAKAGAIADFTGISSPYERPTQPDLHLDTSRQSIAEAVAAVRDLMAARGFLAAAPPP